MRRRCRLSLLALSFVLAFVSRAPAQDEDSTFTTIQPPDGDGTVFPLDMGTSGGTPQALTDESGHFVISVIVGRSEDGRTYGLRWAVYPHQERDYYPDDRRYKIIEDTELGFNGFVNLTFKASRLSIDYRDIQNRQLLEEEWKVDNGILCGRSVQNVDTELMQLTTDLARAMR